MRKCFGGKREEVGRALAGGRVDASVEVDVGSGLFSKAADFVQAAEWKEFALVDKLVRYGAASGFDVEGHGCGCAGSGRGRRAGESGLDRGKAGHFVAMGFVALGHALSDTHADLKQV